jgi:hypothetical protein
LKIALLTDYPADYLHRFHQSTDLRNADFEAHRESLLSGHYGSFPCYRSWFRRIGHETHLLIPNEYPLQQKWLDERHVEMRASPLTKHAVALRQVEEIEPDVLFVASMFDYYGDFFEAASEHAKAIVTWIACPHPARLDFSNVSCVFTTLEPWAEEFRAQGVRAELVQAAFDEDVLPKLKDVKRDVDVSFVGDLARKPHSYRADTLRELIDGELPIKLWGFHFSEPAFPWTKSAMHSAYQGEAWGVDMFRILARSRITLNFHIDVARAEGLVGNMRLFEATGAGAMLITDTGRNMSTYFTPDQEIVTFTSVGELREKIHYYLDHPAEQEAIAHAGQRACLERHSYRVRIRQIERLFMDFLD